MEQVSQVSTEVQSTEAQKAPRVTKIGQAKSIFSTKLLMREAGAYTTNKQFRADVIQTLVTDLGVNVATASTMYNTLKNEANKSMADTPELAIGRDPKKVKPASSGKRGRPLGSKNKPKAQPVAVEQVQTETAESAESLPA